jgi:hypothetical protein
VNVNPSPNRGSHHRNSSPPPPARRHHHHSSRSHRHNHAHDAPPIKTTKPTKIRAHSHRTTHHVVVRTPGTWLPHARRVFNHAAAPPPRERVNFVTAAFVKPQTSVLSTGLDIVAFIALLVFSSLALWLVTSEVSKLTLNARRLRAHRIAGVTRRR